MRRITLVDSSYAPRSFKGHHARADLSSIEIRRKLGIGPGSILEWGDGDQIVVWRSARFTSEDVHRALFPERPPKSRTVDQMKDGIRRRVQERYTRR